MFRRYLVINLAVAVLFAAAAIGARAQTGQLRGHVKITQADGTSVPASEAAIDVYRTDLSGTYTTKTNKKGEFVFAGLPFVGTYVVAASHPTATPSWLPNVKAGREVDYELVLSPGDGKKLTYDEIKTAMASGGLGSTGSTKPSGSESAEDKAKREEIVRKNAEIMEKNKKIEESNAVVARTFKAGNEALLAKNYDEAIRLYNEGLAADADQAALLTNKALALKARGVDRYNAAIQSKEDAAKTSGLEAAKSDFREAAESTGKAIQIIKADAPAATDPAAQARYSANKLASLATRAETMRLFVTKVDQSQVEAGLTAYQEYLAAETDAAKKDRAEHEAAQMLFDANSFEKALEQYKKILEKNPDDTDALVKSGMLLFNIGAINNNDKDKYQQAANYLQQFVDKAPDTDKLKPDAKAILEELKNQQNVKAEKTTTPTRRRRP
ncbi:MAG TPA: carboxypeptidase regulatory-like domain-containing protein [Pyrinomonadaceae bacterium]|nr:carboxypeptidase regulatory-like domain-containing protein [Pyrinomonadaceae bacterium]